MIAPLRVSFLSAFLLTAACALPAFSQVSPAPPLPVGVTIAKSDPFAREGSLFEEMNEVYHYEADGTGYKEIRAIVRVQDDSAIKNLSVLSFSFASSHERVDIEYVRVRRPDGSVVETPAADAQQLPAPITREAPFYSDLKEEQIPIRSLRAGDHLEYKLRIVSTKAEAPGHFWGRESVFTPAHGIVILAQSIELQVPKGAYVKVWSPKLKATTGESGGYQTFRWQSSQLHPIAGVDKAELHKLLTAEATDGLGKLPDMAWTNFHDWAEVGAWYRSMEGNRIQPDDEVKARVKELLAGKKTDEEKVQALYNFVGPQVRYIGVAFGIGRYQPHEASDVLRNQYGDCKDKNTLLTAMLTAAGFTSDSALIGAGVRFNPDVPSPDNFNHVITLAHVGDKTVWLDSTAEVAPYGMLQSPIRDKQALVVPIEGPASIQTTPKTVPFPAEFRLDANGSLDEQGTSHSHMELTMRGDEEIAFRSAARSVPPAQWDELMQNISRAMGYAGKVTKAEFSRPDLTTDPLHVTYEYEREKNGDWDNYRILPQFLPIGLPEVDEKDLPINPIEIGVPHVQVEHAVMALPTGWGADLPSTIHAKASFATLDKTYRLEDGKLICDRRLEILTQRVPASEWRAYKKWYDEASLDGESYIQLTRTGGSRAAGTDNRRAADLIREAVRLEQEHNMSAARERIDEAKALNPQQAYIWSNYGYLAWRGGKLNEAADDYEKELAAHPDEESVYLMEARLQLARRKSPEAVTVLQRLIARNPQQLEGGSMLAGLLTADKKYTDAETILRKLLAAKPENTGLQYQLADALIHAGKNDEGTKILTGLIEKSDDPGMLNNASYALANSKLALDVSEKGARHAIALLEEKVANTPATETGRDVLQLTESILNVWDTLGWALYQEGKTAEAEPLIRAAWENSLAAEPGYHLGVVLEKLGQPAKAMAVYQVALFGDKSSDGSVNENNLARQQALQKAGTPKQLKDAKNELQNKRTYQISGNEGHVGWGIVTFNISSTGISGAQFTQGENKETLTKVVSNVNSTDFHLTVPPGTHARLLRQGVLSCHLGKPCEVVLLPSRSALTAE